MIQRLNNDAKKLMRGDLLEEIAGILESAVKRRLADEKEDPEGKPWKPWSPEYAKTRKAHHSLLINTGSLRDDIASEVSGATQLTVFTVREYGGYVQATRPYMGASKDNLAEVEQAAIDYMQDLA